MLMIVFKRVVVETIQVFLQKLLYFVHEILFLTIFGQEYMFQQVFLLKDKLLTPDFVNLGLMAEPDVKLCIIIVPRFFLIFIQH